ncbi:hypothetical protein BDF22DRAFT_701572 [Syncephalis plumigaleata]|nr:hypothetical protein BDF22DRAFT_701572 [Syncephalis plumigaleata]
MKGVYPQCFLLLLLCFLLSSITPQAEGLRISNKEVTLSTARAPKRLATFRYNHDGQFQYQVVSMQLSNSNDEENRNTTYQQNVTLLLIAEDNWASFSQSLRGRRAEICQERIESFQATASIPFANLTNPIMREFVQHVSTPGDYAVLALNCAGKNIKLKYNLEMRNIASNGEWTQFAYGLFQLPWMYLGFAGGVWPLMCIIWWIHLYKYQKSNTLLYKSLIVIPHCRLVYATLLCVDAFYYSQHGEPNIILSIFSLIFRFISSILLYAICMFISKGWCVTRRHMLKLEIRTVIGTAFFASAADTFYEKEREGAVLAFGTMHAIMFMYLWLNFRHQQVVLAAHLFRLRAENSPKEVLFSYAYKALLLFHAQRVIVTFGLISIAINFFTVYLLGNSGIAYVSHLSPELTTVISVGWLGWLFRLRKTVPIDLSKSSSDDDDDDDNEDNEHYRRNDWQAINPFLPGGIHSSSLPATPTAPNHAFNDTPVVEGIGAAGARRRIVNRLFRRETSLPQTG